MHHADDPTVRTFVKEHRRAVIGPTDWNLQGFGAFRWVWRSEHYRKLAQGARMRPERSQKAGTRTRVPGPQSSSGYFEESSSVPLQGGCAGGRLRVPPGLQFPGQEGRALLLGPQARRHGAPAFLWGGKRRDANDAG